MSVKHTKWIYLFLAAAVAVGCHQVSAQQFGLTMGETVTQIRARGVSLKPQSGSTFSTSSLPSGNKLFDDYRLLIAPKSGLCKIVAWISEIVDTPYGDSTKNKYSALYSALTAKYGNSKSFDFLRADSIWTGSREWMMSLYKEERILSAFWDAEEGSRLPKNIQSISLVAHGSSSSTAMISVSYEFNNLDSCRAEKDAIDRQNL